MADKRFLSEKDIAYLEERLKEVFITREEFTLFHSTLFDKLDEILHEVKASREEQTILASRSVDQGERIASLEKIHPGGQHKVASS